MYTFSVRPATLRSTAITVDAAADAAADAGEVARPTQLGHAPLGGAIAAFVEGVEGSWRTRMEETSAIAEGLRQAATRYEVADEDGSSRVRIGAGGAF